MTTRDEQFTESAGHRDDLQSLIEHPGWKLIVANLDAQIKERTNKLDDPLQSREDVYLHEYMKGARQMARFILDLPRAIIETSEDVITAINEEKEIEDGEESDEESGTDD